ncbi:sugar transferase [Acuticoccus sp. M5D2P5]|uniref:sugar transferase n=1 Tax=Acuticoccus kalidii TaxID=2910977 RepID=UPI001F3E609E|nr:sugar transferase [Acuticoccus kalidii]MCF3935175.1 sugar transferase [Acuticoccus kalidii]
MSQRFSDNQFDKSAVEEIFLLTDTAPLKLYPTEPRGIYRNGLKRALDLLGAASLLLVFAPFFVVVAIAIASSDGRPLFFGHERTGRNGKTFRCLKFRTMVRDADGQLTRHLDANPDARREWNETRKLRNDPRVHPIGRLLRISSLDELPQLFNVLRGDMSLVGPRPVPRDELFAHYDADSRHAYLSVRPGMTGLWQVSGRSNTTYLQRTQLDETYIRTISFSGDLSILWKTAKVLISRDGSC